LDTAELPANTIDSSDTVIVLEAQSADWNRETNCEEERK